MKASNLDYRLYAARCRRLDREEAAADPAPLWVRISTRWQAWALWAVVELTSLGWLAGMFK